MSRPLPAAPLAQWGHSAHAEPQSWPDEVLMDVVVKALLAWGAVLAIWMVRRNYNNQAQASGSLSIFPLFLATQLAKSNTNFVFCCCLILLRCQRFSVCIGRSSVE